MSHNFFSDLWMKLWGLCKRSSSPINTERFARPTGHPAATPSSRIPRARSSTSRATLKTAATSKKTKSLNLFWVEQLSNDIDGKNPGKYSFQFFLNKIKNSRYGLIIWWLYSWYTISRYELGIRGKGLHKMFRFDLVHFIVLYYIVLLLMPSVFKRGFVITNLFYPSVTKLGHLLISRFQLASK